MIRGMIIATVVGAALGWVYWATLGIVKALPIATSGLLSKSIWVGELLESAIALLIVPGVVGALVATALRRWVVLKPLFAALGFFVAAAVSFGRLFVWSLATSKFGVSLLGFRLSELVLGALLLAGVWRFIARRELSHPVRQTSKDGTA
jgi:hypothetical protein